MLTVAYMSETTEGKLSLTFFIETNTKNCCTTNAIIVKIVIDFKIVFQMVWPEIFQEVVNI